VASSLVIVVGVTVSLALEQLCWLAAVWIAVYERRR
jgi:hypothetical protein